MIATGTGTQRERRQSIAPTYDSRVTGPRYHVTSRVNGRVVTWERRVADPFICHTVTVGWPVLLRSLVRRRAVVEVLVGADRGVVEDVMELDASYLGTACTRRDEFIADVLRGGAPGDDLGNGQPASRAGLS